MHTRHSKLKFIILLSVLLSFGCSDNREKDIAGEVMNEQYRPRFHFTPAANWMNDPNGLVYYNGVYHLFFQYYPDSTVWGPMHWGHATSKDLFHWEEQPIALYPDSLGYIFSGCIVVDSFNTSGLGKNNIIPLVAVFTHHQVKGERSGREDFQYQSLAYSLDSGETWRKYEGNPVLKNPGIKDFRDPNVMWYEAGKKWIMTLATKDRVTFYSSPDLKDWKKESEYGEKKGAHGGVWECPDLFSFDDKGKKVWVLTVSINPGGPNGGSATQYFIGDFDGNKFTSNQQDTRWVDYGTDNYAGVTWHNTGDRKIFLGWMSNWDYAQAVPTKTWRSAMTLPREMTLSNVDGRYLLSLQPVKEFTARAGTAVSGKMVIIKGDHDLSADVKEITNKFILSLSGAAHKQFLIKLSNEKSEELLIGYDETGGNYFIDRTRSGNVSFDPEFPKRMTSPRLVKNKDLDITIIADESSVEFFADGGLTNMTTLFFPQSPYNKIILSSMHELVIDSFSFAPIKDYR